MKTISALTGLLVAVAVVLAVASYVLPRLLPIVVVLFILALIGRMAWFYTR